MKRSLRDIREFFIKILKKSRPLRLIHDTCWNFYKDDGFTFSAGISFYFMLSLIPFIILLGATTGYVIDYIQDIRRLSQAEMIQSIDSYLRVAIPFINENFASEFIGISDYKASLTAIGFGSLLISATLLFSTLHYTFFRIFGGNFINFIFSRLMGVVFLLSLTIILFSIHFFITMFSTVSDIFINRIPVLADLFNFISNTRIYGLLISTVFIIFLFAMLVYYFTYGVKRSKRAILYGALLFSIMWNGAKLAYNYYITEISNLSLFYGSATWIITSILWIYYSSLILIICMEFIKSLQKVYPALIDRK
ncbi:MAG TPA: YihY/virulence factor BrkB family protein [bacterium]|nr:YihY/virulence factor BrkB family protein [bacterium]HPS31510.1 YihY/virulence factor BrkB family protein [bacterium]